MLLLPVFLRLFCGFSHVFSSLHLVLRGREDVAHAVSRPSFCVRTPGLKRAVLRSSPQFCFAFNHHRVSLVFGRRRLALVGGLVAIWRAVAVLYK